MTIDTFDPLQNGDDDTLLSSLPDKQKAAVVNTVCRIVKAQQIAKLRGLDQAEMNGDIKQGVAQLTRISINDFANSLIELLRSI